MLRTDAIKSFLMTNTRSDLASLYCADMECQVNVAQDGGDKIKGEYEGRMWGGYTDNITMWKHIRIPLNARTEPSYEDREMTFSLQDHAEGVGMTGWDWKNKVSRWVAYDFDAMIGHSERHPSKLTLEELQAVKDAASKLDWATVRKSTSGKGLHIYVFLDPPVPTANHTEHAALARSILHYMCLETGFSFDTSVDVGGGNMWIWHRKMRGTDGLTCIKKGVPLTKVPVNWRDHIEVARGKRRHILPNFADESFEELMGHKRHVPLDARHKELITYLDTSGASFWWDQDHHMLVAHTFDLQEAHAALKMQGVFTTVAKGSERGTDHNAFLYPLRHGAWVVRRYSPEGAAIAETDTWDQDGKNYTRCYLNQSADLKLAARSEGGVEHTSGGFLFSDGMHAIAAAKIMGVDLNIPEPYSRREIKLKKHKDGRLVAELKRETNDDAGLMKGWLCDKTKVYSRIYDHRIEEPDIIDVDNFDDMVRHLVSENEQNLGWAVKTEKQWTDEQLTHVNMALRAMGLRPEEIQTITGNSVLKPWQIVNRPFEPEYGGDRTWNRNAAKFRYAPNLDQDAYHCPTWDMILHHVGQNLTNEIKQHEWCRDSGIVSGADYLRCWAASVFQKPYEQLPYLFLWGKQNTGKSILHEALGLLMTQGYVRADMALQSQFNGELERAVICVIEETDLQSNKKAYNIIKDCVTSLQLSLHVKGSTPVMIPNTTHWIHCSNDITSCPIFAGDTRVTAMEVPIITNPVAKRDMMSRLQKEASDFLGSLLKLELPACDERLNLPVIETQDKRIIARSNETLLETFINDNCFGIDGQIIPIGEFYDRFNAWLEPVERIRWTKIGVSKAMPTCFPKGRSTKTTDWCYGNISFDRNAVAGKRLVLSLRGDTLVPIDSIKATGI